MTLLMRRKGRRVVVVGMSFMVTRMVTIDVEAASCCEDD